MLKKTLFMLYIATLAVMAAATFVKPEHDTDLVATQIYGSRWFALLWTALAVAGIAYFVGRRVRRLSVVVLHTSFVVILLGALLTHTLSEQGTIHLRIGETLHAYTVSTDDGAATTHRLPFSLTLTAFDIIYHEGTTSAADYVSVFTVNRDGHETTEQVSMNKIFTCRSVRFCQMSYDDDMRGSRLSVNYDPYGIPVTYTGYALLFVSLVWMLVDPKGGFRRTLRALNDSGRGTAARLLTIAVLAGASLPALARSSSPESRPHTLSETTAERFGKLYVMYNGRICPVQTLAVDFTKKLYGRSSYKGYSAEQVLAGFILWPQDWMKEPIIKLKSGPLRDRLQLPEYASVASFFNRDMGGYILGSYVDEYYKGADDKLHRRAADIDDRLLLVMNARRGALLKIFPYRPPQTTTSDSLGDNTQPARRTLTTWYAPGDKLPETMEAERKLYIRNVLYVLRDMVRDNNTQTADELINKMRKYQLTYGGTSLPSPTAVKAERLYNAVPFTTILFIVNLTLGLLSLPIVIWCRRRMYEGDGNDRKSRRRDAILGSAFIALHSAAAVSFLALSLCLALRWIISGTVPMTNGYETMLLTAWLVMLLTVAACRRLPLLLGFGLMMSGFFLLVSHINRMDPQITHIMPVLSSPLLSVHVSLVMMSFALLSLTFICSITALGLHVVRRCRGTSTARPTSHSVDDRSLQLPSGPFLDPVVVKRHRGTSTVGPTSHTVDDHSLQLISRLFLYPAVALLGAGIFIGAVWANMSWGTYWSWDPKEVWALITLMVYAVAVHTQSVPALQRPGVFHIFMALAFLTVVMTYFGVNYILGGMHSYA